MIDKYVESMKSDGIIEESPSAWGSPVCIVAKTDVSPRFCVDYRNIIDNSFYEKKRGQWPISSLILIQLVARNLSLFATSRALPDKYH